LSSFTPWLSATIFGFAYVTAAFFLVLWIARLDNLKFLKDCREFAPFLAVLTVSLSYVVGLTAHYVSDYVWVTCVCPSDAPSATNLMWMREKTPAGVLQELGNAYDTLVLFRHLFFGSLLCLITIFGWLSKNHLPRLKWTIGFVCLFATVFFCIAWRYEHSIYIDFLKVIKAEYKWM
jgi:hypothetical protein